MKGALLVALVERFYDVLKEESYRPAFESEAGDWWQGEKLRIERLISCFYRGPFGLLIVRGLAGDGEVTRVQGPEGEPGEGPRLPRSQPWLHLQDPGRRRRHGRADPGRAVLGRQRVPALRHL